ncbi:MAG TPA: TlpA disulfide reductase family protein [Polyangia bacterium]|nr:TlpA disulfide reductase family protein [Polyangia bacterium]
MPASELAALVRRFPATVGALLVTPRAALREIQAAEKGGFSVLVGWCLAAAVALRFISLADAFVGLEAGGGMRIVSVLVGELTDAVPVALGAALLIVVGAGAKRDPSVDLELGCAATVPFMVARSVFRAAVIVGGHEPPHRLVQASYGAAGVWALALVLLSLQLARARPVSRGPEPTPAARAGARRAGWGALAILGVGLIGGVVWTVRNPGRLGPVTRGAPAPEFSLPRIDGKPGEIALSSLRGQVVVLDFWATWCPPCLAMLPTMHDLATELAPRGVAFLGVDSDGEQTSPEDVQRFVVEHAIPYPVVYDRGFVNDQYRVRALPTMVVVARDGSIVKVLTGMTGRGPLEKAIETALSR